MLNWPFARLSVSVTLPSLMSDSSSLTLLPSTGAISLNSRPSIMEIIGVELPSYAASVRSSFALPVDWPADCDCADVDAIAVVGATT